MNFRVFCEPRGRIFVSTSTSGLREIRKREVRALKVQAMAVVGLAGLAALLACGSGYEAAQPIGTVQAGASTVSFDKGYDWPQWRGPRRDGVSRETGLVPSWSARGPLEIWRKPLGDGYSGVAVADGRVYTLFQSDAEYLVALDAATGKELWRFKSDSVYQDGQGDGPRGTPTFDDGVVYAVGAKGKFHAVEAATGQALFSHDLVREFSSERPTWGFSTSPLVIDGMVYVEPGGGGGKGLAGFEKKSGALAWNAYSDSAGYSSPMAAEFNGQPQILFFTARHLVSFSPPSKQPNWEFPWRTSYDVNAATPILIAPDRVFISTGYGVGAAMVQVQGPPGSQRAQEVWRGREMKNHFNSSVYLDGYLYGFDDATLKCIDAANGETRWRQRGLGKGSLIAADGKLIVLGERGALVLAEASPEAYRELARAQVLEGKCWTTPTLARGKLYLRNQSEILCLALDG